MTLVMVKNINNVGVGCGLSCGIDSYMLLYYFDIEDNPYKLTHVTNFHAGASESSVQRLSIKSNIC